MYPVLVSFGPLTIYSFGIFAALAFFFGSFVFWKRGQDANLSDDEIFDTIILMTLAGLIGARIFFIIFHYWEFGLSWLSWFSLFRRPGMSMSGGLIGGLLAVWFMARRRRWEFFSITDAVVTGLSLAQTIGWLGAFFAGQGTGRQLGRFGVLFPGSEAARFPSQLLWVVGWFLVFVFLWRVEERYRTFDWYRGKRTEARPGFLTFSYLAGFGVLLGLISQTMEARVYWMGISLASWVGMLAVAAAVVGLYWRSGRELTVDGRAMMTAAREFSGKLLSRLRSGMRRSEAPIAQEEREDGST